MGVSKNSCYLFKINPDVALNRNLYKCCLPPNFMADLMTLFWPSPWAYERRRTKRKGEMYREKANGRSGALTN